MSFGKPTRIILIFSSLLGIFFSPSLEFKRSKWNKSYKYCSVIVNIEHNYENIGNLLRIKVTKDCIAIHIYLFLHHNYISECLSK